MTDPRGRPVVAMVHAQALAAELASVSEGSVDAVILYGSHLLGANPDRHSALDFVVVVDDYRRFYGALRRSGEIHRPVWLMTAMARILAPNVIAFTPGEGSRGVAKCLVVSRDDFERARGPRRRDHFLVARMVQKVAVIWGADPERTEWARACLAAGRSDVLDWVGPYLDPTFDAASVGRRILEVCYRGEFRPEARNRADTIFESQRSHFAETLEPVLRRAESQGRVVAVPGGYRFTSPDDARLGLGLRLYFLRSKARVTARWVKHVFTFDNWLPYIVRKVERRTGMKVELTPMERRLPLLFLWPRVIRVLRARPEREDPS